MGLLIRRKKEADPFGPASVTSAIFVVELHAVARHDTLVVTEPLNVWAQLLTRHRRYGLDVWAAINGNLSPSLPITDNALGYAQSFSQPANPSGGFDG
jgi:hypothetical protein